MAKHPWLFDRGGRYYLRARVPADLTAAIGRAEIKRALRTSDRREANRRINREAAAVEAEFSNARRRMSERRITKLSESEIRRLALDWFHEQERDAAVRRWAGTEASDRDPHEVRYDLAGDEAALLDDSDPYSQASTERVADDLLADRNLRLDPTSPGYGLLCELIVRGGVEGIRRRRAELSGDLSQRCFDKLFDGLTSDATRSTTTPDSNEGITLDQLIDRFSSDPARGDLQDKTLGDYAMLFRLLREVLGPERRVRDVSREDCRGVRDVLEYLPPNARKRFRGTTLVAAARYAREHGVRPMTPVTANKYLNQLSTLLRWAEREEYIDKNPAVGLRIIPPAADRRDARRPFSTEQLNGIFSAPLFTGCRDDGTGYARPGPNHPRRARFWLPLISLFHGLRLNEACQLHVADVEERDGVDVILVAPGGEGKKLKSQSAHRYLPVHPEAVKIGFLDYVAATRDRGEVRLFPELRLDGRGYYSDAYQKWFSRFLISCGATAPRTSFHSFRHCWADAAREANIPPERMRFMGGWSSGSGADAIYGGGFQATTLHAEIRKLQYPDLDLSNLYV